jgi:hypothetical protein
LLDQYEFLMIGPMKTIQIEIIHKIVHPNVAQQLNYLSLYTYLKVYK